MNQIEYTVRLIKEKPYIIAKDVGFADVKEFPHNEWMKTILTGAGDYTLLAHRGSYKSSVLSVCIALLMVVYPKLNIIFLRKADNDVTEMIRMVKKSLESKTIQSIAFTLYKKKVIFTESTASTITTNLFLSSSGASQLLGIGLKSSITGKHADLVFTDDICNVADRISKAERDRTKLQFQELQNVRNRGGRIISLGTKWHADDVFSLMENVQVYDYKKTGLISENELRKIRERMTAALFACNYELKIIASEDVIFTSPQTGGDPAKVQQGITHIDAAYDGEDYTAFTAANTDGETIFVYGRLWRKHVDDVQDQVVALHEQMLAGKMYCEDNGDKGYLGKELRRKGLRVNIYHESMNKFLKISTYLKGAWKNVVFVDGTDEEYVNQICDFTEDADHDDAPDSLSSIIRLIWKKKPSQSEYIPPW